MRFVVFSPVVGMSSIGRITGMLTSHLVSRNHEVIVVRSEAEPFLNEPVAHEFGAPVVSWRASTQVWKAIARSDVCLYEIGNHYGLHIGGLDWMVQSPGIVCLHDFVLVDVFRHWMNNHWDSGRRVLERWYGPEIADRFIAEARGRGSMELAAANSPMTEWVASQALAVLTHGAWGLPRVLASCPGPVAVAPLISAARVGSSPDGAHVDAHRRLRIVILGTVNANKLHQDVIAAMGSSALLREGCELQIVGDAPSDVLASLSALASTHQVRMVATGHVSDEEWEHRLAGADVVCCLRRPAFEAASGSLIEALLYAKPVIVTDAAFYGSLPDDVVHKVPDYDVIDSLRQALEDLCSSADRRAALGARARSYAERTFTVKNHADILLELATRTLEVAPVLMLTRQMTRLLHDWGLSTVAEDPRLVGALELLSSEVRHANGRTPLGA